MCSWSRVKRWKGLKVEGLSEFSSEQFSRDLKIAKAKYVAGDSVDEAILDAHARAAESFDVTTLTGAAAKKAFWINVYNGLTNYLIIKRRVRGSMMKNPTIFFLPKFRIGALRMSLDDIEHGILRANRRAPYKPIPQFLFIDQRRKLVMESLDYRIHFALNCGALSCPPIAFYDAENIEEQLAMAEKAFTDAEFRVDPEQKTIRCSEIFRMYRGDFIRIYVNDPAYENFRITWAPYDWTIA